MHVQYIMSVKWAKSIQDTSDYPSFKCVCWCVAGHQKQVGPELFRVFYTIWKETEAEAQEVCTEEHIQYQLHHLQLYRFTGWHTYRWKINHFRSSADRNWNFKLVFLCLQAYRESIGKQQQLRFSCLALELY